LTAEQVRPYRITYHHTKSGKNHALPITPALYEEIRTRLSGRLFVGCYKAFGRR